MRFPAGPPSDLKAEDAFAWLVTWLGDGRTDDELCRGAVTIGEPIVDRHWDEIGDELLDLARTSGSFRKMLSCCWLDASVSRDFAGQLLAPIRPEEQVGRRRVSD